MSETPYAAVVLVDHAQVLCPHCKIGKFYWSNGAGWTNAEGNQVMPRAWKGYRILTCPSCQKGMTVRSTNRMRAP